MAWAAVQYERDASEINFSICIFFCVFRGKRANDSLQLLVCVGESG